MLLNGRVIESELRQNRRGQRPSSMYETREGLRTPNWQMLKHQVIIFFKSIQFSC